MAVARQRIGRWIVPVGVFAVVMAIHFLWRGLFPERDGAQDQWVAVPAADSRSWMGQYVETGGYWLGYSYSLSLAFAAAALDRHRRQRRCCDRRLAIGGVSFGGLLAAAGCFLIGCCGSPMLPVYLSLFGAAFLPLVKPLVAGLTTLMIAAACLWLVLRERRLSRLVA